jgi:hypothetical protein
MSTTSPPPDKNSTDARVEPCDGPRVLIIPTNGCDGWLRATVPNKRTLEALRKGTATEWQAHSDIFKRDEPNPCIELGED